MVKNHSSRIHKKDISFFLSLLNKSEHCKNKADVLWSVSLVFTIWADFVILFVFVNVSLLGAGIIPEYIQNRMPVFVILGDLLRCYTLYQTFTLKRFRSKLLCLYFTNTER